MAVAADVVLLLAGLLRLGSSAGKAATALLSTAAAMDADSQERISIYMQVLSHPTQELRQLCLVRTAHSL